MPLFPILLAVHVALAVSLFLPSLILPFLLRSARTRRATDAGWPVRLLLAMQGGGAVFIGIGLALTGGAMLVILGSRVLGQPWLLVALVIYALNLVIAAFISRPSLRRLARLPAGRDETEWRRQARRQRWIAYAMAAATGLIGLLMTTKPQLW